VIGGAPGAGKTTFAVHLAHAWAQQGIPVGYIAGDEPREGVLIRLGQQLGLDRTFLEEGRPVPLGDLEKHLAPLPLLLVDPDDDPGVEVESVAAALRRRWGEGPAVLVIDSLQSMARRIPDDVAETPRSKVDAFLKGCKAAAKRHGIVILCLSELARGAYSGGPMATNDLAAAKESGAIEYEAGALCVLRSVEDEPGLVSVTWAKSRPGRVEPFGLMINHRMATVGVTEAPSKKSEKATEESHNELLGLVVGVLKRNPGLPGASAINGRLQRREGYVRRAIKELLDTGVIENRGTPSRPRLFWMGSPERMEVPESREVHFLASGTLPDPREGFGEEEASQGGGVASFGHPFKKASGTLPNPSGTLPGRVSRQASQTLPSLPTPPLRGGKGWEGLVGGGPEGDKNSSRLGKGFSEQAELATAPLDSSEPTPPPGSPPVDPPAEGGVRIGPHGLGGPEA
jgi:hypothetical protein